DQIAPSIACDGSNCLVTWSDSRVFTLDIYGARVAGDAAVLDPSGLAITTILADRTNSKVTYDGPNYWAASEAEQLSGDFDIDIARVDPQGIVLDPGGIPVSASASFASEQQPAIACGGGGCLTAWQDKRFGPFYDIVGARLSSAGALLDPAGFLMSTS